MLESASLGYEPNGPSTNVRAKKQAMRFRHASLLRRIMVHPTAWRTLSDQHATSIYNAAAMDLVDGGGLQWRVNH